MRSVDLIYQYLKEYSKETVEQFDDLMDQAEQGKVFAEEDIDDLCNLLLRLKEIWRMSRHIILTGRSKTVLWKQSLSSYGTADSLLALK